MSGLTSQQIIQLACQAAKVPSFVSQAGQFLNAVLSDLNQQYDFDKARKTVVITLSQDSLDPTTSAGPYALPADYLRCKFRDIFYSINGVQYFPIFVDQAEYDQLVQTPGFQSYPTYCASDMSQTPPVMYFWPPPSGAYATTIRYFCAMPNITNPESSSEIPWFPNQNYLITRVAAELMKLSNDDRKDNFLANAADILTKYMKMQDDRESKAQNVQLDRRRWNGPGRLLPNTKTIGWLWFISILGAKLWSLFGVPGALT
jgi:hypothetical protein